MVNQSIVSRLTVKKLCGFLCGILLLISFGGCRQQVRVRSLSDTRLPAAAKQRIADGEDAVLIAQTQVAHAKKVLDKAVARQVRFLQSAPSLGAVQSSSESLMTQRVGLREQELKYLQDNGVLDKNVDKYLIKSSNIKIIGQEIINLIGASDTFRELFLELNDVKL